MLAVKRKALIKENLQEKKSVMVSELALEFDVTEETIRRDLKTLEDEGFLTRTYGGAFIQDGVMNDVSLSLRETYLVEAKQRIAELCVPLVHNGDSIFLDGSTTALTIAKAIKSMRITVMTNSLSVAACLAGSDGLGLIMVGGVLDAKSMSFTGTATLEALAPYYVDAAFLSCRSLSLPNGVTDSIEQNAAVRKMMVKRSEHAYLVADHTKFDKTSFIKLCDFSELTGIITDSPLTEPWHQMAQQEQLKLYEGK